MNLALEYIKYQRKAKRRHGIHSPFVYDLSDRCLRLPLHTSMIQNNLTMHKKLAQSTKEIDVTDLGAGSKSLNTRRKVRDIYKTSSSKGKYGRMLHQLVAHYQPKEILELGTSLGIGSICMASGNDASQLTTIEGCPETHKIAVENFQELKLKNIEAIQSDFRSYLKQGNTKMFDLVFVDGHHDGAALEEYMELLAPMTHNNTIFVLDDIRWSDSMLESWNRILNSERYHLSIDMFRMGIVVPRSEQEKEHFTLRL